MILHTNQTGRPYHPQITDGDDQRVRRGARHSVDAHRTRQAAAPVHAAEGPPAFALMHHAGAGPGGKPAIAISITLPTARFSADHFRKSECAAFQIFFHDHRRELVEEA